MGHDFDLRDANGDHVGHSYLSGNWGDLSRDYKTGACVWHGHTSITICRNIAKALEELSKKGVRLPSSSDTKLAVEINPNWYWGVDKEGASLEQSKREEIFMRILFDFYSMALEESPTCRWYSDQVWTVTPYNSEDGYESDGASPPASSDDE